MNFSELVAAVDLVTPRGFYTQVQVIRIRDDQDITRSWFSWDIYVCHYGEPFHGDAPYLRVTSNTLDGAYSQFRAQTIPWIRERIGEHVIPNDQSALVDVNDPT